MSTLKESIESTNSLYNNLKESNEDFTKIKEMLKKTYTEFTKCKQMIELFSDFDNYEIYDTKLFSHPTVCIFKSEVLDKVYGKNAPIGSLNHFENNNQTEIVYPVIIISSKLYNADNQTLLDFIICHELGHYRKNHVSSIYFQDGERHILKEVEADLYACNIIGIEGCVNGLRELAAHLINNHPSADVDEVIKRLVFISRKYGIAGALEGFELQKENKE